MSMRRRRVRSHLLVEGAAPPIVRKWLLRMLVPLGAMKESVTRAGWHDENLRVALGQDQVDCDESDPFEDREFDVDQTHAEICRLYRLAERGASKVTMPEPLASNIESLRNLVGLSDADTALLAFAVVLHTDQVLGNLADAFESLTALRAFRALSVILGIPLPQVRTALDHRGALSRAGLITQVRNRTQGLANRLDLPSNRFADHVASSSCSPIELLRDVVVASAPGHLSLADFGHLRTPLKILLPYLKRAVALRRVGVNVLVHGAPGTGKNQLVKTLAAEVGCRLFEVASQDDDGDPVEAVARLSSYRAAQSMLANANALVLFDEVQDIFASGGLFAASAAAHGRKAWINAAMEGNPIPTLWLTNSIGDIDGAHIRRFDMVLECPVPPRLQRQKIAREACAHLLDDRSIERLADCDALAPAVVARAASVVNFIHSELEAIRPDEAVLLLVDQTLKGQRHAGLPRHNTQMLPEIYDPAFVRTGVDLTAIATRIAASGSARICLYGPPGSGKTAWARWLALQMDRPLLVRRASDLISMWVGKSERNVADAFRQAQADDAVLLIDEVDSFLQDRRTAKQSWDVTLVNEMLTQMEAFDGVFIASTNLIEGLDEASLRRFDLKLHFGFLAPAQASRLLTKTAESLGLQSPTQAALHAVEQVGQLTPGDFATVARKHRLQPLQSDADLVAALHAEVGLKSGACQRPIGFL